MAEPATVTVEFRGRGRSGVATTGRVVLASGDLSAWVKAHYRAGWRQLTVTRGGEVVGAIEPTAHKRRVWWAVA